MLWLVDGDLSVELRSFGDEAFIPPSFELLELEDRFPEFEPLEDLLDEPLMPSP